MTAQVTRIEAARAVEGHAIFPRLRDLQKTTRLAEDHAIFPRPRGLPKAEAKLCLYVGEIESLVSRFPRKPPHLQTGEAIAPAPGETEGGRLSVIKERVFLPFKRSVF